MKKNLITYRNRRKLRRSSNNILEFIEVFENQLNSKLRY